MRRPHHNHEHHQHHQGNHAHHGPQPEREGFFEHLRHHLAGRHHHGGRGGFGRFGGPFSGDGEADGRGMRMGRKLGSGDLQLLILSLLQERPRHGYEIIKALEERSKGFYTPSPGMVYPALTYLEEIEYATVTVEGTRKLYQITAAGQAHLSANQAAVDALFQQFARAGDRMEQIRRVFADEAGEDAAHDDIGFGRGHGRGRGSKEMHEARHMLKEALMTLRGASAEEQQRVIEILKRAAEEIRSKS